LCLREKGGTSPPDGELRRQPHRLHRHVGSGYPPDFRDCILCLEDVEEVPYSLDRMLTQLKLAVILGQAEGASKARATSYINNSAVAYR